MQLEAYFYDGQTSKRTQCVLEIDAAGRFILPNGLSWSWAAGRGQRPDR